MKKFTILKKFTVMIMFSLCVLAGISGICETDLAFASEKVYIGGLTVGIELDSAGVVVSKMEESNKKHKENGEDEISDLQNGDVIQKIDSKKVTSLKDLQKAMQKADDEVEVELLRNGELVKTMQKTYMDGEVKKLGIFARDTIEGIGTITYIKDDGNFGGLGHPVSVWENRIPAPIDGGKICSSMILGVNKGVRGKAGELKGVFVKDTKLAGDIKSNNACGIYGKLDNKTYKSMVGELVETADKTEVQIGEAQIYSTISGNTPKMYTCEIVTKDCEKSSQEKGMVLKITDPELLGTTGGIVQGMSGSPIVQNGKLIGAVTHVFIQDPTRGYGIFIENMLSSAS